MISDKIVQSWFYKTAHCHPLMFRSNHNFNTSVFCLIFTGKQTFQSIFLSFAWYLEMNGLISYFCLVIRTFKSFSIPIAWYLIWSLKNQSKTRNTMPKLGIRYYLIRSVRMEDHSLFILWSSIRMGDHFLFILWSSIRMGDHFLFILCKRQVV